MKNSLHKKKHLTSAQIIIFGFGAVILLGTLLLMLPVSTRSGNSASLMDALFTSTSAVCVTGLIVQNTVTYWSEFGQAVIMCLIQIGGMGVVTVAVFVAIVSGRKIGLMQRSTMQEAIAAPQVGGIVRLTGFILKSALVIELLGAGFMFIVFYQQFGVVKGVWYSLFHSVSAFCNAGFDLLGTNVPYSSLVDYAGNPIINIVIMLLIITGGIGFLTWDDIRTHGIHFIKYRMQSKVILVTTGFLILLPAIYFFFFEFGDAPLKERVLSSFFQSVTPRTAGFNTVDLNELTDTGQTIITILMLIGGSPGSTAGGFKTTTLAVLCACVISVFRRKEEAHFFGRRISDGVIKHAATVLMMYLVLFLTGGLIISYREGLPMQECLFETASAIGTVGLTLGITPELGEISRLILVGLMFFGRVGGLTLIYAALSGAQKDVAKLPLGKMTVG